MTTDDVALVAQSAFLATSVPLIVRIAYVEARRQARAEALALDLREADRQGRAG